MNESQPSILLYVVVHESRRRGQNILRGLLPWKDWGVDRESHISALTLL